MQDFIKFKFAYSGTHSAQHLQVLDDSQLILRQVVQLDQQHHSHHPRQAGSALEGH